jgi:predicted nucleotidyltransferase
MSAQLEPLLGALVDRSRARLGERLVGLALYGSVARGTAGPSSDVDLLVVADGWPREGRLARQRAFDPVERDLESRMRALRAEGFEGALSPVLWSREELNAFSYLHLDLATDARILHDPAGVLADRFAAVRRSMAELGTRKVPFGGAYYWLLKPDLRPGEIVQL